MASDTELLENYAKRRDDAAFGEIVRRHGGMVYRTAARVLGNDAVAEDVAQTVFFLLAERAATWTAAVPIAAWLHATSRRTALAMKRDESRRARREIRSMQRISPDDLRDPNRAAVLERLDDALDALPEPLRQAVLLRHLEGYSQIEAARIAGCPQGTLAWRTSEGMAELRRRLASSHQASAIVDIDELLRTEANAPLPDGLVDRLLKNIEHDRVQASRRVPLDAHPRTLLVILGLTALAVGIAVWAALRSRDDAARSETAPISREHERAIHEPCDDYLSLPSAELADGRVVGIHAKKVLDAMRRDAEVVRLESGAPLFAITDGVVRYAALMTDPMREEPWTLVVLECAVPTNVGSREIVCASYFFSGRADPATAPNRGVRRGDRIGIVAPSAQMADDGRFVFTIDPGPYRRMSKSLEQRARAEAIEIAKDVGLGVVDPAQLTFRDVDEFAVEIGIDDQTLLNVSLLRSFSGDSPPPPPLTDAWFERAADATIGRPSEFIRRRYFK